MNMLDEIMAIIGSNAVTYEKIRIAGIVDYEWRVACDSALEANLRTGIRKGMIEKITIPGNDKDLKGHLFAVGCVSL